jgi:electron transfer flavoprotein alpha subunit
MFQGKLAAQVKPQGGSPALVTMQIGALRADAAQKGGSAVVTKVSVPIDPATIRQKPEAPFREAKQAVDLAQAERIVAVGRGIKSQDNIPLAEKLAKAMDAEVAASRPICDSGWLPMERQIGSSGQTVAPKLYVALGISGAIQHLVGMKGARTKSPITASLAICSRSRRRWLPSWRRRSSHDGHEDELADLCVLCG